MENTDHTIILIGLLVAGLLVFIVYIFFQNRLRSIKSQLAQTKDDKHKLEQHLHLLKGQLDHKLELFNTLQQEFKLLEQEKSQLQLRFTEFKQDSTILENKFEVLAHKILEEKEQQVHKKQMQHLSFILDPLQEKIKRFEARVEQTHTDTIARHESLKEQIKYLSAQSQKVSQDAANLAKALKGDFKKQGNWGEMILENILDKSGLEKGREYHTQVSIRNEEGELQKPDVIIDLPDGKKIIIDSKVSLRAYDAMINAEEKEQALFSQKLHAQAIKSHIDGLTHKNYHQLYQIESPDFVLMFIPIDAAFSSALQYDEQLYQYAFDKNIVLVSSSTLLATLKTVETMWRNDKQNKNALEIASEAGKMYDKFSNFVLDMNKLGQQMSTVQKTYSESMKKLQTGTGNLISRAEKIRNLGAKSNKRISI